MILELNDFIIDAANNYGTTTALKIWKDLRNKGKSVVVKQRLSDNKFGGVWMKVHKSTGFVKALPLIHNSLVVGGQLNPGLQVLSLVDQIRIAPSDNVSSIEDAFSGSYNGSMTKYLLEWRKTIPTVMKSSPSPINWSEPHCSLKAGPLHSSAILSSGLEVLAFLNAPWILEVFLQRCSLHGAQDLAGRMKSIIQYTRTRPYYFTLKALSWAKNPSGYGLAKMAFLSERAGKTRMVYILNWWMQDLLHPLHCSMMDWLRCQPQDGTYDQQSAVERLKEWSKLDKPIYSFDLTSATDRWPKSHQYEVIRHFAGEDWAITWDFCLGLAPWSDKHQRFLHYTVGQPMGAYASWAALAMTHHCLIRSLCRQVGAPLDCYMVLGDDVVINHKDIATLYQQHITEYLGIQISQGKSLLPINQISGNSGEFAKQIVRDGQNLTPVSTLILDQVWNTHQWWMLHTLTQDLCKILGWCLYRSNNDLLLPSPLIKLMKSLPKDFTRKLEILISDPACLGRPLITERPNPGANEGSSFSTIPDPWAGIANHEILIHKLDVVETKFQERLGEVQNLIKSVTEQGRAGNTREWLLLDSPAHPVKAVLDNLDKVLNGMYKTIAEGATPQNAAQVFTDIDYLKKVIYGSKTHRQWKDMKSLRKQMSAKIVQSIFTKCTTQSSTNQVIEDYSDW